MVQGLLSHRKRCRVLGGLEEGRRPYVNFEGARYTNEVLGQRHDWAGTRIWVVNHLEDDARVARAATPDGLPLGILRAAPPWHRLPHSLAVRRAIQAKGSGISYLAHFAPAEFARGNRLARHAEALWAGFEAAWPEGAGPRGRRFGVEVPMQHLALAVEDALRQLAGGRDWADVTAPAHWRRMIARTGFGDHMRKLMAPS